MQHAEQGEQMAARDLPTKGAGMSDIVERLRNWRTVHLTQLRYVMESAADEIERLRLLSETGDCPEPENAANGDILTDAEREAVEWCVEMARIHATECDDEIATMRGLLKRLGGAA